MNKRITSFALALVMIFAMLPATVLAADTFSVAAMNGVPTITQSGDGGYALKNDGSLWTWSYGWAYADEIEGVTGGNIEGPPYDTNSDYIHVVENFGLKANGELWAWGYAVPGEPAASNAIKVADNIAMIGIQRTYPTDCIALTMDGNLVKWAGELLADGIRTRPAFSKSPEILLTNVISFATDSYDSRIWRALKADGTLWYYDRDGNLTKEMDNVAAFSSSEQIGNTTLAIKTDGTLWAWGDNTYGQVGNGGKYTSAEPQHQDYGPFYRQDTPVKILDDVIYAAVDYSGFAITSDGTLYGWGHNDYNELGFTGGNHVLDRGYMQSACQTTPKVITTNAAAVATVYGTTIVLKRDGSLWSCGSNIYGKAGQSTKTYSYLVETLTKMMDGVALPEGMAASGTQPTQPPVTPNIPSTASFTDVPATHWGYDYIEKAAENKLVNGNGNGQYTPDKSVTNAEWCQMLSNLFKEEGTYTSPNVAWWYNAVRFCHEMSWLENTTLRSKYLGTAYLYNDADVAAAINRYDMAQVIYNIAIQDTMFTLTVDTTGISGKIGDYQTIPSKYRTAVEYCYAAGFITGVDQQGTFGGTGIMSRAQAATVLCRLLDAKNAHN